MVPMIGFEAAEEHSIHGMLERFRGEGFLIGGLDHIEKTPMPGYDGKVVPRRVGADRVRMRMYLSQCTPFTVAHELAHVADMAVRRQDSLDNLSCAMPAHWHLAYKMSSEYYANRVACRFTDGDGCLTAFKSDAAGMMTAARRKDWGNALVYYALLLGLVHGAGQTGLEPLKMLPRRDPLPVRVLKGMADFRRRAESFFDGHGASQEGFGVIQPMMAPTAS
ncbi:MAG TPA: hypothetical protein HPQ04_00260 [Rhodospirillaceae bacterium]|nr:hypothetical protein [Rhodospirillaceae bacterium]